MFGQNQLDKLKGPIEQGNKVLQTISDNFGRINNNFNEVAQRLEKLESKTEVSNDQFAQIIAKLEEILGYVKKVTLQDTQTKQQWVFATAKEAEEFAEEYEAPDRLVIL